jgi:hypothetical protein
MATLAVDKPRAYSLTGAHPDYNEYPAIATDIIYLGAAVGESSSAGTGRPLVAGDNFLGFCQEKCDNSTGAAADKLIKVLQSGYIWLTVTSVDNINDVGDTVYASDDDTFTLASTSNSAIGKLIRYDSTRTNKALVYFEALYRRSI